MKFRFVVTNLKNDERILVTMGLDALDILVVMEKHGITDLADVGVFLEEL